MHRFGLFLSVLWGFLLVSAPLNAAPPDTYNITGQCEVAERGFAGENLSPGEQMDAISCTAFLKGVQLASHVWAKTQRPRTFCPPTGGLSSEQMLSGSLKWLRQYRRSEIPPALVVIEALRTHFPCRVGSR